MILIDFIKEHENWRDILAKPPYNLKIQELGGHVLLKYDQSKSDMSNPIVQICRGIIIDPDVPKVVSRKFDKFFNIEEPLAATLSGKITIEEKVDGIMIGFWYNEKSNSWIASSNGNISLNEKIKIQTENYHTFFDLFVKAWGAREMLDADLSQYKDYTIIFELVSPYNEQTVHYTDTSLYLLGVRNNETGQECNLDLLNFEPFTLFKRPKTYEYPSLEAAVRDAKFLDKKEGFVIRDENFNRVKVKSDWYNKQKFAGVKALSKKDIIKMIWDKEYDDYYAAHPEYKEILDLTQKQYAYFYSYLQTWALNYRFIGLARATFARNINEQCPKIGWAMFKLYDVQTTDIRIVLKEENLERIVKTMEVLK